VIFTKRVKITDFHKAGEKICDFHKAEQAHCVERHEVLPIGVAKSSSFVKLMLGLAVRSTPSGRCQREDN
jgi:hypothetical protein